MTPLFLAEPAKAYSRTAYPQLVRRAGLLVSIAFTLLLYAASILAHAQGQSQQCSSGDFFGKIVGDWIGVCEQTTDGEKADDKYFHVAISKTGDNTFESRFEYYRADPKTGAPVRAGESTVVTNIGVDGLACSKIKGKGTVLVFKSPKTQEHNVCEVARLEGPNSVRSEGKGTICVSGMPLGLGKNGKVTSTKSTWTLSDGALSIHQTLRIGFRALFIGKSFDVTADYKAKRGTDIAGLMTEKAAFSAKPSGAAFQ